MPYLQGRKRSLAHRDCGHFGPSLHTGREDPFGRTSCAAFFDLEYAQGRNLQDLSSPVGAIDGQHLRLGGRNGPFSTTKVGCKGTKPIVKFRFAKALDVVATFRKCRPCARVLRVCFCNGRMEAACGYFRTRALCSLLRLLIDERILGDCDERWQAGYHRSPQTVVRWDGHTNYFIEDEATQQLVYRKSNECS